MSVTHFQGGTGDWGLAGNWSGIEPVSNDTAIIDAGSVDITTGLDNTAVDLDLLWISPGYTGNIGSGGGRLQIAADLIVHLGRGNLFLYAADNSAGLSIDRCLICTANPDAVVDIDGDSGALDHVQVLRGNVSLSEAANTLLEIGYKQDRANDARVTIEAGAGPSPVVKQWGGRLTSSDVITLMDFFGGEWIHELGAVAEVNALASGRITWNAAETLALLRRAADSRVDLMLNDKVKLITTAWDFPGIPNGILADLSVAAAAGGPALPLHAITAHHQLNRLAAGVQ